MTIRVACDRCGKGYQLDGAFAGKKAKCKACGHVFGIPAAPEPAPPEDVYGLADEGPSGPAMAPGPVEEEVLPRRPKAPGGGKKARSKRAKGPADQPGILHRFGLTALVLGVGSFLLPLVGLQFRILAPLGPQGQAVAGIVLSVLGAICLALSMGGRRVVLGFGGVVGVLVLGLLVLGLIRGKEGPPPQVARAPGPPDLPTPTPASPGMPGPPGLPSPTPEAPGMPGTPGPPAASPPLPEGVDPSAPPKFELSNARVEPDKGPFGNPRPGIVFQVDYRVLAGNPHQAGRFLWVLKARRQTTDLLLPFGAQGTLRSSSPFLTRADGPFVTYVDYQPPGQERTRVSNDLAMPWMGPAEAESAPAAGADSGSSGEADPDPRPGRRPPFGPRGPRPPFGPRGPRSRGGP